ncbi:F-actin-uncapping protein LRRC16A-like isoform X2 [Limulus polyphemus]|uniref:F-actin-uncapping protein LRRC16A-like isoform X2 n=1 Tax=Limulus polyphemus TaxID=6850 RepID=A0ABM1RX72_LIMPO|nr:F-actin-uncapping protein LRRC16A-like isoform X2 [Limulus polyphemus]
MSTRSALTKDLHESIRNVLGRNVKVSLKCIVRMETKPEKTENRVLAFSSCRLFILTAKVPTKVEQTFHYLDLQAVESKKQNQISLFVENRAYTFYTLSSDSEDVDLMISQIGTAVKTIFPQVPLDFIIRRMEVVPENRLQGMTDYNQSLEAKDPGPCGGFSTQYACMCNYHGLPYREEVAWDVDTIYLSHDSKELSLLDFDHLDGRDLVPIISALGYNAWFTKFRASNIKLTSEALEQILQVMKKTVSIEELYLDNTGIKWDFAHKLSMALISNPHTPLHTLDLSNNLIEDKGISSLSGIIAKLTQGVGHVSNAVGKLQKGLVHLSLSKTGLTSKGINNLAHSLSLNHSMPSTLTYLNLNDNVFKEDVNNLYNFLAQPNSLIHLDLSGTECAMDTVFGALLRGCTQKLAELNLARNQFSTKKTKDVNVPPSFKAFFSSTVALRFLNMSGNKLPLEALKAMLLGLACNEFATDVALDLSSNDLKSQGSQVLESCLPGIHCLCSLDISDNGLDVDLSSIIGAVGKNKSLKHLAIGRNFNNIKSKHITRVLDSVVQLIQEEDSVLESLSLADSKLRGETCLVINALGSNQSLTSIDISGNLMGPAGAKTLAKALQINSKLRCILWDRNGTSPQGFQDIAYALEKNYTLRYMPCPINDATAAMKIAPEKTENALKRIEELLHRNVSPKKFSNGQAFRLQQGFLLSSTQQMVDRLMVHVQEAINSSKRASDTSSSLEEVTQAEGYLNDANNAKQLLTRLHEVVLEQEEVGNPVEMKLQDFVDELSVTMETYLKNSSACMMKCVRDQCPNIMADEKVQSDLETLCQERGCLPLDFIRQCLLEQTAADILNKLSEINLSVAAHLSDRILDEVIETLSHSHKYLVERGNQRSSTPDVLRNRNRAEGGMRTSQSGDSQFDTDSFSESLDSPLATPKLSTKRKSVHTRKLRPQSVVDSVDGIAADDIPDLLPKDADEKLPSLSPSSDKLEHLGKARPKRPKTRAPTRPAIQPLETHEDIHNLGEGLEVFFRRHPNSTSTPALSPDSDEPRSRTYSNSTTASGSANISDSASNGSGSRSVQGKSQQKETEKKGFMKGISSLFSRISTESSQVHKSKSYDMSHKSNVVLSKVINITETNVYSSGAEGERSSFFERKEKQENGDIIQEIVTNARNQLQEEGTSRISAAEKFGLGLTPRGPGSSILAEMKARQEKRSSGLGKNVVDDKTSTESLDHSPSLLHAVKLKPTGLAESLKSPTEAFPKEKGEAASPGNSSSPGAVESRPNSSPSAINTPGSSPVTGDSSLSPGLKQRPPPPIAPKPRPKSMLSTLDGRFSGEYTGGEEEAQDIEVHTPDVVEVFHSTSDSSVCSKAISSQSLLKPSFSVSKDSSRARSMYLGNSGSVDLISKAPSSLLPNLGPTKRSRFSSTGSTETTEKSKLQSGSSSVVKDKFQTEHNSKSSSENHNFNIDSDIVDV